MMFLQIAAAALAAAASTAKPGPVYIQDPHAPYAWYVAKSTKPAPNGGIVISSTPPAAPVPTPAPVTPTPAPTQPAAGQITTPNLPAGYTLITTRPFAALIEDGWVDYSGADLGKATIVSDATPWGSTALDVLFDNGLQAGNDPMFQWRSFATPYRSLYVAFPLEILTPWIQNGSGIQKLLYLEDNSIAGGNPTICWCSMNGVPWQIQVRTQSNHDGIYVDLTQNVSGQTSASFPANAYELVESVITYNSPGHSDGVVKVWVNKILVTDQESVRFTSSPTSQTMWTGIKLEPTWGGSGAALTQNQHLRFGGVVVYGQ